MWTALLAAPLLATAYFLVVYLAAEAACAPGLEGFGTSALRVVIYATTAAAATVVAAGLYAYRLARH